MKHLIPIIAILLFAFAVPAFATGEIQTFDYSGTSSPTDYVLITNANGQVWNGTSFTTLSSASWSTFTVSISPISGTNNLLGNFPTGITTAGDYTITTYQQVGGSPAATDTLIDSPYKLYWGGSSPASVAVTANNSATAVTQTTAANQQSNVMIGFNTAAAGAITGSPSVGSTFAILQGLGAGVNVTEIGGGNPTTATASAIWGATASSYDSTGTMGQKLNLAGTVSDPWATSLPGSYTSGEAGYLVGTNLNAAVGSRQASGSAVTLPIGTGSGQINLSSGNVSLAATPPTTSQIASALLVNPSDPLLTNSSGYVTATNGGSGTDPWTETASSYTTPGTMGYVLNNAPTTFVTTLNNSTVDGSITFGVLQIDEVASLVGKISATLSGSAGATSYTNTLLRQDNSTTAFSNVNHYPQLPTGLPSGRN